jgi:hypothetical protein
MTILSWLKKRLAPELCLQDCEIIPGVIKPTELLSGMICQEILRPDATITCKPQYSESKYRRYVWNIKTSKINIEWDHVDGMGAFPYQDKFRRVQVLRPVVETHTLAVDKINDALSKAEVFYKKQEEQRKIQEREEKALKVIESWMGV